MVSERMLAKLRHQNLFKEILQLCSTIAKLKTLVKNPSKQLFKVITSDKFVAKTIFVYYHCFFENFETLITQTVQGNCDIETLITKLIKQTKRGVCFNTFSFYL